MALAACVFKRTALATRCVSSPLSSTERWKCLKTLGSSGFHSTAERQGAAASPVLSPAVRYLVDTNNIDPSKITATGPKNRLLKEDVLKYLQQHPPSSDSLPTTLYTDIPLTAMRKTIAKRMSLSKSTIPYCYAVTDCVLDDLLIIRKQQMKEEKVRYTLNDVVIKAAALALQRVPESNSIWDEEKGVQRNSSVDISVAVAMDGGLITPIIKNADQLTVPQISLKMKELADRARIGKLAPNEYQGGSFSITNLGGHGIKKFSAIINPPQSAILAVGSLEAVPTLASNGKDFEVTRMMTVTMSCDIRVIDYELACQWLEAFKTVMQCPTTHGLL